MIRVTVELIPFGIGEPQKLGEMRIANDGVTSHQTDGRRGSYEFTVVGKRNELAYGRVENWPRKSRHVWRLVAKCLNEGGFM